MANASESEEGQAGASLVSEEWECPACTLRNPSTATICEACGGPKPANTISSDSCMHAVDVLDLLREAEGTEEAMPGGHEKGESQHEKAIEEAMARDLKDLPDGYDAARCMAEAEAALAHAEAEQALHLTTQERFQLSKASLFVPGEIIHIYADRGCYKAAKVPRSFPALARVELQHTMIKDHLQDQMYAAIQGLKVARDAQEEPPPWQCYSDAACCACCESDFNWNSTLESEAQQMRDRYNCRACGKVVCDQCSQHKQRMPRVGIHEAVRVCDRCNWSMHLLM